MASERRIEKIKELAREELARIIDRELEFPAGTLVTVTRVDISPDKRYGEVFISLLGTDPHGAFALLKKNVYHIQQILNRTLRMRPVPQIHFSLDAEELRREGVEKSLASLKQKGEV